MRSGGEVENETEKETAKQTTANRLPANPSSSLLSYLPPSFLLLPHLHLFSYARTSDVLELELDGSEEECAHEVIREREGMDDIEVRREEEEELPGGPLEWIESDGLHCNCSRLSELTRLLEHER